MGLVKKTPGAEKKEGCRDQLIISLTNQFINNEKTLLFKIINNE